MGPGLVLWPLAVPGPNASVRFPLHSGKGAQGQGTKFLDCQFATQSRFSLPTHNPPHPDLVPPIICLFSLGYYSTGNSLGEPVKPRASPSSIHQPIIYSSLLSVRSLPRVQGPILPIDLAGVAPLHLGWGTVYTPRPRSHSGERNESSDCAGFGSISCSVSWNYIPVAAIDGTVWSGTRSLPDTGSWS